MPAKSEKQRRLMYAALNDPEVRKKTGISKAVAGEFLGKALQKRKKRERAR